MWPISTNGLSWDLPIAVVQPGRPKKARRSDIDEGKNHGRKLRKCVVIHCRKCGNPGHNAATCAIVLDSSSGDSTEPSENANNNPELTENPQNQSNDGNQSTRVSSAQPPSRPKKQPVRRKKQATDGPAQQASSTSVSVSNSNLNDQLV